MFSRKSRDDPLGAAYTWVAPCVILPSAFIYRFFLLQTTAGLENKCILSLNVIKIFKDYFNKWMLLL